jgi:osmoprotectant transport system substrate-binding protein
MGRRGGLTQALAALLLVAAGGGCTTSGGDGPSSSAASSASSSSTEAPVVVGSSDYTLDLVMQQLYVQSLRHAGFTVRTRIFEDDAETVPAVTRGDVTLVPAHLATLTTRLNLPNAATAPVAVTDLNTTRSALKPLASKAGLTVFDVSKALDTNTFYVSTRFASDNRVTALSDLTALNKPVTIAAGSSCTADPYCGAGLTSVYGLTVAGVTGDGFGTLTGKQKVINGDAQLGLTSTTDGSLAGLGLVALEDDKHLQPADYLVPVANTAAVANLDLAEPLTTLAETLTTADLASMIQQVDVEKKPVDDVAEQYLGKKGLLSD